MKKFILFIILSLYLYSENSIDFKYNYNIVSLNKIYIENSNTITLNSNIDIYTVNNTIEFNYKSRINLLIYKFDITYYGQNKYEYNSLGFLDKTKRRSFINSDFSLSVKNNIFDFFFTYGFFYFFSDKFEFYDQIKLLKNNFKFHYSDINKKYYNVFKIYSARILMYKNIGLNIKMIYTKFFDNKIINSKNNFNFYYGIRIKTAEYVSADLLINQYYDMKINIFNLYIKFNFKFNKIIYSLNYNKNISGEIIYPYSNIGINISLKL